MPSTSGIGSSCLQPSSAKSPASYGKIFTITNDPDDNRILECAVEGQAHLIVSGDRDLRRLKVYQGIPIVTPTDFLRTLGG